VALGARRFPRGGRTLRGGAARGGASCLPRQCATRHRAARLALEHPRYRARDAWPPMRLAFVLACRVGVSRTLTGVLLGLSSYRRSKINPRAPRFGEADGNGLLRRPRSMLTPADLADLLAYEFARLCRRRLTLAFVFSRLLDCSLLRHHRPPSAKSYLRCDPRLVASARSRDAHYYQCASRQIDPGLGGERRASSLTRPGSRARKRRCSWRC